MSAHASFAPSSAARWLECPASVGIAAHLPNYDSDESKEGTRVHKLIETVLGAGGVTPAEEGEGVAYAIELMADYVRQLGGPNNVMLEKRLVYTNRVWGTADVFQPRPDVTTIVDYKNGAMDVRADRNKQLMTYAVGALEQHGPSQHYRLVIVQPNRRTAGEQDDVTLTTIYKQFGGRV